jgi:hypothetical protein
MFIKAHFIVLALNEKTLLEGLPYGQNCPSLRAIHQSIVV